ncbi:MAG: hypothetical protein ABSE49_17310 [Polyangiaceae bacterium]|jgi:hypothetical protein
MPFVPSFAAAADKAALVCIQSAEEGEKARKAGALLRARELFTQCQARECPTVLRHDCASWLEEAEHQVPSIVPGAHDPQGHDVVDARVSVDGTVVREHLDGSAIEVDPGTHVVRFESPGAVSAEVQVVVRIGEKNRAVLATLAPPVAPPPVTPPAPPAPPPPRVAAVTTEPDRRVPPGAWLLGGVGVAALGAFAYFGVVGKNDADNLRATCAPGCAPSQVGAVRAKLVAADVALGVGVVSVVAATWIGVSGLTRSRAAAWEIYVAPAPSAARAGVTLRF